MLSAHRVKEISRRIANTGGRNFRPDVGAVLAGETLFDGVAIDFTRDLSPELPEILRDVLWRGLVKRWSGRAGRPLRVPSARIPSG
jgi:hypothetical protein